MGATAINTLKQYLSISPEVQGNAIKCLQIIFFFILGAIFFPVLLFATTIVLVYRWNITQIFKSIHYGKYSLASPTDSIFAMEKHANTITLTSILYAKGPSNIDTLREKFNNKLINYKNDEGNQPFKRLTWRLIKKFGFYTWEDTSNEFDIRQHIKFCPGADQHHRIYTEQEVLEAGEKLADDLINPGRPQWELLIVPKVKLEENGEIHYATIFRIRHAYMDGISVLQMMQKAILDDSNSKLTIDPRKPLLNSKPTILQYIGHYMQSMLLGPYTMYQVYKMTRVHPQNVFQTLKENTGPKYFGCTSMKMTLDNVKTIRKAFKCSTVAVFNSVIAGALRKAAERKKLPVPEHVDFGFTAAVLPYPNENPQNRFCLIARKSPVGIRDPRSRLRDMDEAMRSLGAHEVTIMYWMGKVVGCYPAAMIEKFFEIGHSGYLVTNVPGFAEKIHLDGHPIEAMYGCPPIKNGIAFGIGCQTYMGNIRAFWVAEKSPIISSREDMDSLITSYEKEFSLLVSIAEGELKVNNNLKD